MRLAIVILNWNGKALLEKFLPAVIRYSQDTDIYVADNASTDNSIMFVREKFPMVSIVQNKQNGGYAKGYNDALKEINADVYCLLNSDVEVTENWLDSIKDLFIANSSIAIVQPKILDYKNKNHFEYAGAAGGYIDLLGYPFCRGRVFQSIEEDQGQYNDVREVFWASGACLFVRSIIFEELGGFDEDYFAHQEEIDFCWRAYNAGHKTFYTSESTVYHVGGATMSNMNPKKTFLNFRNSLFSITKNLPKRKIFILIFVRLLLDGIAATRFILQLKLHHCFAILKAHISFYRMFPKIFKKRLNIPKQKKYHTTTSIVWSYFVLNKRKFINLIKD